ncbi:MAG: aspartate-semialdehyde dehydrogenase [Deltaproteobacteria bacterium]|nr:aspartate-semialdehyde dehydrogenase [Deltaproteobacteria bacterium]
MRKYKVAVVGATGAVGREMTSILEERKFPVAELGLFASSRSSEETLQFRGNDQSVKTLDARELKGFEIVLSSPGAAVSREYVPAAVKLGCVVIDNTSAFRMESDVPLVVPEVNPHAIKNHKGIIANPNCSTIQMVVALKPLSDRYGLKRVVVSTYQAVSGIGRKGIDELSQQAINLFNQKPFEVKVFAHQIAFNCLPHIDSFLDNGYTKEEMKMINETRKIMELPDLPVTATTVRVPVFNGHSESVNVELKTAFDMKEICALLRKSVGIVVEDDPSKSLYPMPIAASMKDEVFVGRIRRDFSVENGINMWIAADNLRKGAALNAVQIAERMISDNLL